MEWQPPEMWPGSTVYILGGGPSLRKVDIERLRGHKVIATNNAYQIAPWAPVMFFMDCRWWHQHKEKLAEFEGLKVTVCGDCKDVPWVLYVRRGNRNRIEARPGYLARCNNSGLFACNLAIKFGAKRIILLGFDMQKVSGEHNWHSDHNRDVPDSIYADQFLNGFHQFAKQVPEWGVKVVNATPGSALQEFPIVDPEEVLP